jgi:hypothetical protein
LGSEVELNHLGVKRVGSDVAINIVGKRGWGYGKEKNRRLQFIGSEANAAKGACSAPEPAGVSLGDGAIHFELEQMPATPVFVKKDTLQSRVDDQACWLVLNWNPNGDSGAEEFS